MKNLKIILAIAYIILLLIPTIPVNIKELATGGILLFAALTYRTDWWRRGVILAAGIFVLLRGLNLM